MYGASEVDEDVVLKIDGVADERATYFRDCDLPFQKMSRIMTTFP